jgi:hypothetical protein
LDGGVVVAVESTLESIDRSIHPSIHPSTHKTHRWDCPVTPAAPVAAGLWPAAGEGEREVKGVEGGQ